MDKHSSLSSDEDEKKTLAPNLPTERMLKRPKIKYERAPILDLNTFFSKFSIQQIFLKARQFFILECSSVRLGFDKEEI